MSDPATLPDVVYVKSDAGWSFPASERADMERRLERIQTGAKEPRHEPGTTAAQPLQKLVVEMTAEFDLDGRLEARFRDYYARAPVKASRLAERVCKGARDQSLNHPPGFLAHRLKELER